MTCASAERRALAGALARKIVESQAELDGLGVANACYGLQSLSCGSAEEAACLWGPALLQE